MPYAAGTCRGCGAPAPDGSRCDVCAKERREDEARKRAERRARGACLICSAPVARMKIAGGKKRVRARAAYCKRHLSYYAERYRIAARSAAR